MPGTETEPLDGRLVSQTETCPDRTESCVASLPQLLAEYPRSTDRETVDRISTLEGDCDRSNRRVSAVVADATAQDLGIRYEHE